jgi:hypothetical protein
MRFPGFPEKLILTSSLIGLYCCLLAVSAYGVDWQYWQGEAINKKINESVNLAVSYESRYQNSGKDWFTSLTIVNPMFKISKDISAGPIYYFIPTKQKDGSIKDENRYGFLANYNWTAGIFKLGYRLLYEYRDYQPLPGGYENRIRNRIQVTPDIHVAKQFLAPYFSYELFYSFTSNDFLQTRTCVGDTLTIYRGLTLNVQYLLRQDKANNVWSGVNVFGTYLNYSF